MPLLPDLRDYCLAFDLDGTLVDTAPDIIGTLNDILKEHGAEPFPTTAARALVGKGARSLIQRGFAAAGLSLTPEQEDAMVPHFLALYRERIDHESQPFEGVFEALDVLRTAGAHLAVCTNKPYDLSVLLLTRMGMIEHFKTVVGADSVTNKKPAPEHLKACTDFMGLDLSQSMLIGDSETDFLTARNAGVPSILVSFGYNDTPVADLKPDRLIHHFRELPDAVAACLK
ncbi:phosphoglycolate phosphatase [Asticcacaulis machinosus]|uniref:Phosphoglycolate phosphatase n=1 Tax=Asticcacaulis machinosus TaxID=2984211 RepID=A0ABT5HFY7_9CAUL|nr:phosphoglycolate phosphatase [Asticcacaulis machinosus]MDC7674544.1 phosphoglycolate phosphatase [Asticcacaulis machinosus]